MVTITGYRRISSGRNKTVASFCKNFNLNKRLYTELNISSEPGFISCVLCTNNAIKKSLSLEESHYGHFNVFIFDSSTEFRFTGACFERKEK